MAENGQERSFSYFPKGPIDRLVNRRHNEENSRYKWLYKSEQLNGSSSMAVIV